MHQTLFSLGKRLCPRLFGYEVPPSAQKPWTGEPDKPDASCQPTVGLKKSSTADHDAPPTLPASKHPKIDGRKVLKAKYSRQRSRRKGKKRPAQVKPAIPKDILRNQPGAVIQSQSSEGLLNNCQPQVVHPSPFQNWIV